MREIEIQTLTGNRVTVTCYDGKPLRARWARPMSARDELELLCHRDALARFALRQYRKKRRAAA